MRIVIVVIVLLWISSCGNNHKDSLVSTSKWLRLKDSFAKQNISEFSLDRELDNAYKDFHRIRNDLLDSTILERFGSVYLYSWQGDTPFIEFTTIIQEEDKGVRIMYYVFNENDSLLSATPVAWSSMEAEHEFNMYSKFKTNNTLLQTSVETLWYDMAKREKLKKKRGDTTIVEITFKEDGKTTEKKIAEKGEL